MPIRRASLLLIASVALAAAEDAPLDIRADRLELTPRSGVARFEGNVTATQEDLTLRCDRLTARSTEGGEMQSLVAEGGVTLKSPDFTASAARVEYDRAAQVLVLTGTPAVTRGADRLAGERIQVWPRENRIVVEQARGSFLAPRLRPPALSRAEARP